MKEEREKEKQGEGRGERGGKRETTFWAEKPACASVSRESRMCYVSVMTFSVAGVWRGGTSKVSSEAGKATAPCGPCEG